MGGTFLRSGRCLTPMKPFNKMLFTVVRDKKTLDKAIGLVKSASVLWPEVQGAGHAAFRYHGVVAVTK